MIKCIKEDNSQIQKIPSECIKVITLLSDWDYRKYRNNIPRIRNDWWIRDTSGLNISFCYVGSDGDLRDSYYDDTIGIRPVLILDLQSSTLSIKDKFEFGGHIFTIISNKLAICDDFIDKGRFGNLNYEKSNVKKAIDNWLYDEQIETYKSFEEEDWGF